MENREKQRLERKLLRQLDKQRKKLASKGVKVDLKTLRRQYSEIQEKYDKSEQLKINYSDYFYNLNSGSSQKAESGSPDDFDEEDDDMIDVVGDSERSKKSFSIDSLLFSRENRFWNKFPAIFFKFFTINGFHLLFVLSPLKYTRLNIKKLVFVW